MGENQSISVYIMDVYFSHSFIHNDVISISCGSSTRQKQVRFNLSLTGL